MRTTASSWSCRSAARPSVSWWTVVFHTEEIVVKPMSTMLRNLTMFSGNTILGDGSVIMIIDPNGVASAMASHASSAVAEQSEEEAEDLSRKAHTNQSAISLLLFRAGAPEPKAVPLSLVTRLEEFEVSKIERSNGRDLVQYRGALMPLVYVTDGDQHKTEGTQPMLVFSDSGRSMGLVVDEIVDIVEDRYEHRGRVRASWYSRVRGGQGACDGNHRPWLLPAAGL